MHTAQSRAREVPDYLYLLALAVLSNDTEYTAEERRRVRDAVDNAPHTLLQVIAELHPEGCGREAA